MTDDTLCTIARRAAEKGNAGYRYLDRRERPTYVPYDRLFARALEFAGALGTRGVRPGDKVALVLPTGPDFFDAFFGTLLAGGVPVPLYPPVRLGRMDEYHERTARMLKIVDACLVCTDARVHRVLGRSVAAADPDLGCAIAGELRGAPVEFDDADPDVPALIQFSSGTTIDPKPVVLTHRQILSNVRVIIDAILAAYPQDEAASYHNGVTWLPMYHDMGLIGCAMVAIAQPADLTLIPPELFVARPAIWLRAISTYRGTVSPAPNFAYSLCVERIKDKDLEGVDLSSWRVALNGAEPVTPSVLTRFVDRFADYGFPAQSLTPVYGLAEAALAVTFSDFSRPFSVARFDPKRLFEGRAETSEYGRALVSVGRPLPGYAVEIRDGAGGVCSDGTVGTVFVHGPSVMKEYYGNPAATAAAIADGWLDTGDTGFVLDGELYVYGRAKDLVIVRGKNYAPQMIELALDDLAGMRKGCCAAAGYVPDDDEAGDGERLIVFVERGKDGDVAGDASVADEAGRRITTATGLVADVVVLDPGTILRTSSGKIRRAETLRQYLSGTLAPPKEVGVFRMATEMLRSRLAFARTSGRPSTEERP